MLKSHFEELELSSEHIQYTHDGKQAYDLCVQLLTDALDEAQFGDSVKPIDLIITDLQMPKMTGMQVLQQLRLFYSDCQKQHSDKTIILPEFVFLTAFKTNNFQKYLQSQGVQQCYDKPISQNQLLKILMQVIN